MSLDFHRQSRPVEEDLGQSGKLLLPGRRDRGTAVFEFHVAHFLAAPDEGPQQGERGSGSLDEKVFQDLEDHTADPELRIAHVPGHRQVELDPAVAVLQQGDGQPDRQCRRLGAVHMVSQGQLVDFDMVPGIQLLLHDVVF